jgi:hypothetical protein
LPYKVSLSYFKGSSTCRKILWQGADSFTSPLKEGMVQIFIILKIPLPSARYEPANLGSNGKHANHQTTKDDWCGAELSTGINFTLHTSMQRTLI